MLDLNLSVSSMTLGTNSKGTVTEKLWHFSGSPKESSRSFNTISASDEDSPSNNDAAFAYSFSILKNSSAEELDKYSHTIQLFPMTGVGEEDFDAIDFRDDFLHPAQHVVKWRRRWWRRWIWGILGKKSA
jgi:hypothetical protein